MINRAFIFVLFSCILFILPCQSQNKVALVIGNAAYEDSPLRNPVNDANDMAQALRSVGFTVLSRANLNKMDMENSVRSFREGLNRGDVALFYYSGHGMQVNGINYLIPVGESIYSEVEIPYKSMEAQFVIDYMQQAGTSVNIIILDACRNNPFKGFKSQNRGLVPVMAPQGTFIAYSTSPGALAFEGNDFNSPYTKYLIYYIKQPGLQIEEMFKKVRKDVMSETGKQQVPWESSSLIESFSFCLEAADSKINDNDLVRSNANDETNFQCGTSFTITHTAGDIAPVTKKITYGTVETDITGSRKCWITQNLGAERQAISPNDTSIASAGWYWFFNRKQGFVYDGKTLTPELNVKNQRDKITNWQSFNDPCLLLLGNGWRLPTYFEWQVIIKNGAYRNCTSIFSSKLKMHASGGIQGESRFAQGIEGHYWSGSLYENSYPCYLYFDSNNFNLLINNLFYFIDNGCSIRCIRD